MSMSWKRLRRQLMADKRKFGVLLTCAVLGLLLWGRLLLPDVPKTADAVPKGVRTAGAASGNASGNAPGASTPVARRRVTLARVDESPRDLFRADWSIYARVENSASQPAQTPKSVQPTVDKQQQLIQRIESEARALTLQSTLLGAMPHAVISGELIPLGGGIKGFTLTDVSPRQVTVAKEGLSIVLTMDRNADK